MSMRNTVDLAVLRFDGSRFEGHALDVECTRELIAYRNIVLECAKELWKRKNPDRERLPRNFEDGFQVEFGEILDGSAAVPLRRVKSADQAELDWGNMDEFDEAALLVDKAILAADTDQLLPTEFPNNVIPLFSVFGKTLGDDEVLYTKARHASSESAYTHCARKRLSEWVAPTYEDSIDVTGEVCMAQVGKDRGKFSIVDDANGATVEGRFDVEQEAQVLEALRNHRSARLRVKGVGEFETQSRTLKRIARVDEASQPELAANFDENAMPIWDQLSAIGEAAPDGTWDAVPTDLSTRIDDVVYRRGNE